MTLKIIPISLPAILFIKVGPPFLIIKDNSLNVILGLLNLIVSFFLIKGFKPSKAHNIKEIEHANELHKYLILKYLKINIQ